MLFCAHGVLVLRALGCREKNAKPLRLELSSHRHLEMISLTFSTQAGKNYGFPSFLLLKAMKVLEKCACRGVGWGWGGWKCSLGIYLHQAKNTFK